MFTSKKLIGTPQRGNRPANKQEFTPIGNRSRSTPEDNKHLQQAPNSDSGRVLFRPIAQNHDIAGMSFADETMDDIDTLNSFHNAAPEATKQRVNRPSQREFVNNGFSSIKEQEDRLRSLDAENYRLKLNVLAMQRLLSGAPEDHRKLFAENVALQSDVAQLQKLVESLKGDHDKENSEDYRFQLNQLRAEFKQDLEQKDSKLHHYEHKIEELESRLVDHSSDSKMIQNLRDELHDLSKEYDNLKRRNEHNEDALRNREENSRRESEQNGSLQDKLAQLEETNHKLSYQNSSLEETIENLNRNLSLSQQQIEELQRSLLQINGDSKDIDKEANMLRNKLADSQHELSRINSKYEALEHELRRVESSAKNQTSEESRQLQNELSSLERVIRDKDIQIEALKSQNNAVENDISQSKHVINRLQREIDTLEEDLSLKNNQISELDRIKKTSNSSNYAYESQISSLSAKIERLNAKNHSLEDSLDTLRQESNKLRQAKDREIEQLQGQRSTDYTIEKLQQELQSRDNQVAELRRENRELMERVSTQVDGFRTSDRVTSLESEKRELLQTLASREETLVRVQKVLDLNSSDQLEHEIHDLLSANRQLKDLVERANLREEELDVKLREARDSSGSRSHIINQLERRIDSLEFELHEKENLIRVLESNTKTDDYSNILKAKSHDEIKIRNLEYEINALKSHYELELNQTKDKLENLERDYEGLSRKSRLDAEFLKAKSTPEGSTSAIQNLLEFQLKESTKLNEELSRSLSKSSSDSKILEEKLSRLESENHDLLNSVSEFDRGDKLENSRLKNRISELTNEHLKATNQCKRLVEKVNELTQTKQSLAAKVEEFKETYNLNDKVNELNLDLLNEKVDKLNLNLLKEKESDDITKLKTLNKFLQSKVDQMSRKLDMLGESTMAKMKSTNTKPKQISLLENQLTYYKARLHDFNMKSNDLQIMNAFILSSIKNSNQLIKNDVEKLIQYGIYPDYKALAVEKTIRGTPLTFSVLAKYVLAGVRIKRRFERSEKRRLKLDELRNEIEKEKIFQ